MSVDIIPAGTQTLDELAATAVYEHDCAMRAGEQYILHALRVGEALNAAKQQVPYGEWCAWAGENLPFGLSNAYRYMRLAYRKQDVLQSGATTISAVERLLRDGPTMRTLEFAEARSQAEAMSADGVPQAHIADLVGVARSTVSRWVGNTDNARRLRGAMERSERRRREKAALRRLERDTAARRAGGSVGESYSLVRKALQEVERAQAQATDREIRAELAAAMTGLHAVEDRIVRALGVA